MACVFLLVQAHGRSAPSRFEQLTGKLTAANVHRSSWVRRMWGGRGAGDREQVKEAAKQTYAQSVAVSKEVIHSVRMGRAPNVKKLKRIVQAIVDQILNEETSLFGLTLCATTTNTRSRTASMSASLPSPWANVWVSASCSCTTWVSRPSFTTSGRPASRSTC